MGHSGGHLAQGGEPFTLGESSFKTHILFNQPAVFDRDSYLAGEYFEHGARVLRE